MPNVLCPVIYLLRVCPQMRKITAFVRGKTFSIKSCQNPNESGLPNRPAKPHRGNGGNIRHYSVPGCSSPRGGDGEGTDRVRLTPTEECARRGSYGFVFLGIIGNSAGRCKIGQPLSTCDCLFPPCRRIASFYQHADISTHHLTIYMRLAEMAKHRAEHFREFSRRGADLAT